MLSSTLLPALQRSVARAAPLAVRASSSLSDPKYIAKSLGATSKGAATAKHAMQKSCYYNIDFKIDGEATVYEAVQRFAAYNVGALVVTTEGKVNGIISERDYVTKIALLGKSSKTTKVHEVATTGANLIVANLNDSIEECMRKMLARDIRHLPISDDQGDIVGMLSIKDIIKEVLIRQNEVITRLTEFNIGKGAFFEHT